VIVLATVRPDDWNFPLFVHVLGAMVMVGALVLAATALVGARRGNSIALVRLGFRSLLWAALPAWLVMRLGGEWIASKEDLTGDNPPNWVSMGFTTADLGILLLVAATVVAGLGVRRLRSSPGGRARPRVATVLVSVLLVAYLVAIWAMTTKPT
jgi:hypothetical protein